MPDSPQPQAPAPAPAAPSETSEPRYATGKRYLVRIAQASFIDHTFVDEHELPCAFREVVLRYLTGPKSELKGFTDENGRFFVSDAKPGKYQIELVQPKHQPPPPVADGGALGSLVEQFKSQDACELPFFD